MTLREALRNFIASVRSIKPIKDDPDLIALADAAYACCVEWYGPPDDPELPVELVQGPWNRCSRSRILRQYIIYLYPHCETMEQRCSAIGHEMYHRVTMRRRGLRRQPWIDEMIACLTAQWFLRQQGFSEYADFLQRWYSEQMERGTVAWLRKAARPNPIHRMFVPNSSYIKRFYTSVTCVGMALDRVVASKDIRRILTAKTLADWINSLPSESRYSACRILELPPGDYRMTDSACAHIDLGCALMDLGDLEAAVIELQEALSKEPDNEDALFHLGCILYRQKRYQEAINAWLEVARLKSDNSAVRFNLGIISLKQEDCEAAIHWFEEVLRLQPDKAAAHYCLGDALWKKGEHAEAHAAWEKALALDVEGGTGIAARKALEEHPLPAV